MSYEIYYNKQFVKVKDKFIPMLLTGSNNCTEVRWINGRQSERRERHWWCQSFYLRNYNGTRFLGSAEDIINSVVDYNEKQVKQSLASTYREPHEDETYIRNHFGYFNSTSFGGSCSQVTYTQYMNYWKNGIKQALTIEQLNGLGINLYFDTYISSYAKYKFSIPFPQKTLIRTTEQFTEELKKWLDWEANCTYTIEEKEEEGKIHKPEISIHFEGYHDHILQKLLKYRKSLKQTPAKELKNIEVDHYYTLQNEHGYLYKYGRRGYKYSPYDTGGKRFFSLKEAENYIKALIRRKAHHCETWKPVQVNLKTTFARKAS